MTHTSYVWRLKVGKYVTAAQTCQHRKCTEPINVWRRQVYSWIPKIFRALLWKAMPNRVCFFVTAKRHAILIMPIVQYNGLHLVLKEAGDVWCTSSPCAGLCIYTGLHSRPAAQRLLTHGKSLSNFTLQMPKGIIDICKRSILKCINIERCKLKMHPLTE